MDIAKLLGVLGPRAPILPDPTPASIQHFYSYGDLKEYRLQSAPYIVSYNYDLATTAVEDGVRKINERSFREWLVWVKANG